MGRLRTFFVGLCLLPVYIASAAVSINEVMPCNISSYMDESLYNFSGYVEFYNSGSSAVNLNGYKIVHNKCTSKNVYKLKWTWNITTSVSVPAGGYKLVFFDGASTTAGHAPYKLDSDGGELFLYDASGNSVSSLRYPAMTAHVSYGNGGYMEPSPLAENTETFLNLTSKRCAQPTFSGATPGVQTASSSLTLSSATSGATIYYTTDGTEPLKGSSSAKVYSSAIKLSSNMVIRAKAYADGYLSSAITTGSFIFMDDAHKSCNGFTVPIVSLVVDEKWLTDDTYGIAVKGTNGAPIKNSCLGTGNANFMQDWDRPVNFEYIVDGKQVVTHEAEIGVMGGCSRGYDVKSFKVKAGKKTGSSNSNLGYDFFQDKVGNKYKSVHIRNGGNAYDEYNVRCRDGYMVSLAKMMDIDYQAYEPVAYYINGEYKGLMGLRERTNGDFVEANYGLDDENIDVIKITNGGVHATSGDSLTYDEMVSVLENGNPTSGDYYTNACKYIDMNEYIDYLVFEHFIVNTDWPANNCKLWREKDNGRFRWIVYDTDFGLGLYGAYATNYCDVTLNSIEWTMGEGSKINWANGNKSGSTYVSNDASQWKVTIFKHLMQNEVFKEKFLNRNLIHLGTTFTNDRVQAVWDSLAAKVQDEHCAAFDGLSLTSLDNAKSMVQFAKNRPTYMYSYLKSYYGLGSLVDLSFSSDAPNTHFMMNDELVNASSFSGKYFTGKTLKLEAIAPAGYEFDYWEAGDGSVAEQKLTETSTWKYYYADGGLTGTSWTESGYNDAKWSTGYGKMGYATDNTSYNTVLDYGSDKSNKYITAYFRNKFTLSNPYEIEYLNVNLVYDDAYVLYLNGHEVKRDNIEGDVEYSTLATDYKNDETTSFQLLLSDIKEYLKTGENTIAVEIHQNVVTSSDLTFQLTLTANYAGGTVTDVLREPILVTSLTSAQNIVAHFTKSTDCPTLPLLISEVASTNNSETDVVDEYGNHPDWFEIYNNGSDTINLAGLYITDNSAKPTKSMIPYGYNETKLAPGAHFVVWADGNSFRGVHHANFKLANTKSESETGSTFGVYMYSGCNTSSTIDEVEYTTMDQNTSYGRVDDNSDNWTTYITSCDGTSSTLILKPTPGRANGSVSETCGSSVDTDYPESVADVAVYPNPVEDILEIQVENASHVSVQLYDQLGKVVLQKSADGSSVSLDLSACRSGAYTLRVLADNLTHRQLILKR